MKRRKSALKPRPKAANAAVHEGPGGQLEILDPRPAVVHFWDEDEALRTGRVVRKIKRGKRKGQYVVADSTGKRKVGPKIRNIE